MVKFYEKIDKYVRIDNVGVIPLMLHMRWFGQPVGRDIHLIVSHPNEARNIASTEFHKVLWDDVDESNGAPYRKARLRLEGKQNGRDVYALLEFNLDRSLDGGQITFSPVPFGCDGRPKLPKTFRLEFAAAAFSLSGSWKGGALETAIRVFLGSQPVMNDAIITLLQVGIIECKQDLGHYSNCVYQTTMIAPHFEEIFGVKLPSKKPK